MTVYTKTMMDALAEVRDLQEDNMDLMRKAAGKGGMQTLKMKDGKLKMDKVTASAMMQIFDKLSSANQKKMEKMINDGKKSGIIKLSDFAMSKVTGFKSEDIDLDEGKEKSARQLVDPKKEVMVVKKNSVIVIDKKDEDKYLKKGWSLAEEIELDEAPKYELYHKDFSSAMQHAYKMAKKLHGITIKPSEIDDKVASGPRKPSEGKTNTYRLEGDKGAIQVQVYNKGGSKPYELNFYKENVDLDENFKKMSDDKLKAWISKNDTEDSVSPVFGKQIKSAKLELKSRGLSMKEEVEIDEATSQVLAHGGKGQYKVVSGPAKDGSRETVVKFKGKVVSRGDYDSGADGWYMNIKGKKGQEFFDDAQKMADYFAKNKIREEVDIDEYNEIGTDEYRKHTQEVTPGESEEVDEASARADARRHGAMRKDKDIDPADVDTDASDDDVKGAAKNIIMQMRKVVSMRGNFDVEFLDKKKKKVPVKIAQAVQDKYNSFRKPADKEKFQAQVAKSYKDMLKVLKAGYNEETILGRIDKKLKERKNG